MNLVLLDEDRYFGEMFAAYLRASSFSDRYAIRVFTSAEQGKLFVEQSTEPFIFMIHESLLSLSDNVFGLKPGCTILISDQPSTEGTLEFPVLCKYQPLDKLLTEIAGYYNEYSGKRLQTGRMGQGSRIVGLFSASGGMGKTVTALHLARQWVLTGSRPLCICLEQHPSRVWYPYEHPDDQEAFSQLLYYVRSNPRVLSSKLNSLIRKHPLWRFDYIPPFRYGPEALDMSGEELSLLLKSVEETGNYDKIVVDLDSCWLPLTSAMLKHCTDLLWLVNDDLNHLGKANELLVNLEKVHGIMLSELHGKLRFVLNKWTGQVANDIAGCGIQAYHRLPYISEWKSISGPDKMFSGDFAEQALRILEESGGRDDVGHKAQAGAQT